MNGLDSHLKIVGIGGLPRSGKDKFAELFIESGFFGVSLGDIVRNISRTRHSNKLDPISRANTTETSNWLRQTKGSDFALKEALALYEKAKVEKKYRGLLVWSVRAPVEVDFILRHDGHLIWVEAADEVRYKRAMNDLRVGEVAISLEEFKKQESKQWTPQPGLPEGVQMNIAYVKENATDCIENNFKTLNEFNRRAKEFIDQD